MSGRRSRLLWQRDMRSESSLELAIKANTCYSKAFGHKDCLPAGDEDEFGEAFDSAGRTFTLQWTLNSLCDSGLVWSLPFCRSDTDGDGKTNGDELGDPCCEWNMNNPNVRVWWWICRLFWAHCAKRELQSRAFSHPGVASSVTSNPSCALDGSTFGFSAQTVVGSQLLAQVQQPRSRCHFSSRNLGI